LNFLFHHHLASRDLGNPVAAIGAMLPDLWRMADGRLKARESVDPEQRPEEAATRQLLRGIRHHLALDTLFHASPLCRDGERRAAELLRAAGVRGEKMILLGHIAWELCLDGALLECQGLDTVKTALRQGIAALDPETLRQALFRHQPTLEAEPKAIQEAEERLIGLFHQLAWGNWIDGYRDGPGLTQRLQGVRRRLRLPPLDADDRQRAAQALDTLLDDARGRLDEGLAQRP
jgi:acyl carrier protein phosphodiesterase